MDKEKVEKIFQDFKELLFINLALDKNEVTAYDFYDFLKDNPDLEKQFKKIEDFNNAYNESVIAEKAYGGGFSQSILLEMLRGNNKKKFTKKIIVEDTSSIQKLSDEELDEEIRKMKEKGIE